MKRWMVGKSLSHNFFVKELVTAELFNHNHLMTSDDDLFVIVSHCSFCKINYIYRLMTTSLSHNFLVISTYAFLKMGDCYLS